MGKLKRKVIDIMRATKVMDAANSLNNWRYAKKKTKAIKEGKSPIDAVYDDAFFKQNAELITPTVKAVVDTVIEIKDCIRVVDFGCGGGQYLKEFYDRGSYVFGVDGSNFAKLNAVIPQENFQVSDLTKPINLGHPFSVALCFEVAEHIPTEASKTLVKNITSHAPLVFFTAAPPGQGGTDHINEQPPEFWIKLFKDMGFTYLDKDTEAIRISWKKKKVLWWIANNIMLFEKKS